MLGAMHRVLFLVAACGCGRAGMGISQTAMIGRASRAGGDATFEQRIGEITMYARLGRVMAFADAGLGGFNVRIRSGDTATQPDDLGLGDRSMIGVGYAIERGPIAIMPYLGYGLSLANSSLIGGDVETEMSEYRGGVAAGVELALDRDAITGPRGGGADAIRLDPYFRAGIERSQLRAGATEELTASALVVTIGVRIFEGGR